MDMAEMQVLWKDIRRNLKGAYERGIREAKENVFRHADSDSEISHNVEAELKTLEDLEIFGRRHFSKDLTSINGAYLATGGSFAASQKSFPSASSSPLDPSQGSQTEWTNSSSDSENDSDGVQFPRTHSLHKRGISKLAHDTACAVFRRVLDAVRNRWTRWTHSIINRGLSALHLGPIDPPLDSLSSSARPSRLRGKHGSRPSPQKHGSWWRTLWDSSSSEGSNSSEDEREVNSYHTRAAAKRDLEQRQHKLKKSVDSVFAETLDPKNTRFCDPRHV